MFIINYLTCTYQHVSEVKHPSYTQYTCKYIEDVNIICIYLF